MKRGWRRNAYFCIVFSQLWRDKIHSFIKRHQKSHGLRWIQVRISCHQLRNIGQILQGHMVGNIVKGIELKDSLNRGYNCNSTTKVKGTCSYRGELRPCCVVYKYEFQTIYFGLCGKHLKHSQK